MKKIFYFSSILILIFTIFSCSPALSISLKNDDSVDVQFEITNTESFFSNFSAFMDFSEENLKNAGITRTFINDNVKLCTKAISNYIKIQMKNG